MREPLQCGRTRTHPKHLTPRVGPDDARAFNLSVGPERTRAFSLGGRCLSQSRCAHGGPGAVGTSAHSLMVGVDCAQTFVWRDRLRAKPRPLVRFVTT